MSNYLKCPFCNIRYNLTTNIPRFSQCGGVYCSSCLCDPCRICKSSHTFPPKDFLPFKDYLQKNLITCICSKNLAVIVDGKSFLPYCLSCVKSYQKGIKVDSSEFGLYINTLYAHFVEKFRKDKKREMVDWMIEYGLKGLSDKLMTIRMAEQYITESACCWVHLDRPAKFVNQDLEFHCGCEKERIELTDSEACKLIITSFIGKNGLTNKFLINQLTKSEEFSSVKSTFEAKRLNRVIKPSDICSICTRKFGPGSAFQLSTIKSINQVNQIVCNKCLEKIIEIQKESFEIVEKTLEYSINCSNCSQIFLVLNKIPLENQDLIPFKLTCGHNVCNTCKSKTQDGKILCKICQLFFKFKPTPNKILINILNKDKIYCDIHHLVIIKYSFYPLLQLFCEKCNDANYPHISELFIIIKNNFKHLIRLFETENLVSKSLLKKLRKLALPKHKFELLSEIAFEKWFNHPCSIDLVDDSSLESISDFSFLLRPSVSIVITGIEFIHTNIDAKFKVSILKIKNEVILKPIKIFYIGLGEENSYVDLRFIGCIPLIKNLRYEFEVYNIEYGYTGYKVKNQIISPEGVKLEILFGNNDGAGYSLIKSIDYLILPN